MRRPVGTEARPAVFLDRDGTIIEEKGFLGDPRGVALLPGAAEGLAALERAGFALIVVSNQSGVARGFFDERAVAAVNAAVDAALRAAGGPPIDGWYFCPHGPDEGCACRKPAPELLLRAARERGIDLERSFAMGDKPRDLEAGRAAGVRATVLVSAGGAGEAAALSATRSADFVARDLREAARWILDRVGFESGRGRGKARP
jgi:D-glycero-D-manno-heptose 1,7-bisphosphate phosphatase